MVNLSHSKLKRKGHTEEKYVPAAKISRKQIEVSFRKNSIGKNANTLAFKEINSSLLKVDKSQIIGNGTFGNCCIALYRNEYRVVDKEMKIQSTSDNSNLQGKSKKVQVIGCSKKITESKVKNSFFFRNVNFGLTRYLIDLADFWHVVLEWCPKY